MFFASQEIVLTFFHGLARILLDVIHRLRGTASVPQAFQGYSERRPVDVEGGDLSFPALKRAVPVSAVCRRETGLHIRAGYRLTYQHIDYTPMLLMVHVHPSRAGDLLDPGLVTLDPPTAMTVYTDGFGNRCTRLIAPPGLITISTMFTIQDSGEPDVVNWSARQTPVPMLPDDVLVYLMGSRYCETDRLSTLAWQLFGQTPEGWPRVQAIVDYVHQRIRFDYQMARATRTAWEAHEEQVGVCRDFAHLAVTLCRCMNIPARYCTGYLGDIGIPPVPDPMDFSAWFDVYLDGIWYTFDARHNKPRIGRILMARGRDATDVAISTSFGKSDLVEFGVVTDEI
ncbi:Transglutaminase family protein [Granulibacter bethesdensis CGDNIH1]|uniref:Transglutaminase family protein n=1 Tax=Granulibacter bethesdensis (strain ATCC BAA-1260 / CGDNIH1) TaxID=391165 RepID=Q0BSG6_GRABC|nr:Transglutaminase family protein [Granulibacter bethesdensis CGDNIH1]APH52062.1 Transglutaminase family protein [Granulibacter bethesdensis]APH64753.1 Transglutaminase family protein [Granulibacter bethesdensis]